MLNATDLKGIIPPTTTPLTPDDTIDRAAVGRLMDFFVEGGAGAIFALGSSGESVCMTREQKLDMVDATADALAGRLPLLTGISSTCYRESLALAHEFAEMGADAVVATAPYFFHYSQQELIDYFTRLAEAGPLPLLIYDIPVRTGNSLTAETILTLAQHERIIGLKDTTNDVLRGIQITHALRGDDGFAMFQGTEGLLTLSVLNGYAGGVLGIANVCPRLCREVYDAAAAGDAERARELQEWIDRAFPFFFAPNPGATHTSGILGAMKVAQELQGLCDRRVLFPLTTLTDEQAARVREVLQPVADAGWLSFD
ncbi:MAG: dihydrodipicolinate synthase family protein [Armatimonadetes bacterium]|nr:dihydrodipicolinate synthase family protein [Armatimonadota bacterium]